MSESLMKAIMATPGEGLGSFQTLELLLLVAGYHDYTVSATHTEDEYARDGCFSSSR